EFAEDQAQRDLFLLALANMQTRDPDTPSSFFSIAGIHGFPHQAYAGIPEPPGRVFCEHQNALFPVWHRPYMVLFESALRATAKWLVDETCIPSLRPKYKSALAKLRLPYWDWARTSDVPAILTERILDVEHLDGVTRRIPNPLREYQFQKNASEERYNLPPMHK